MCTKEIILAAMHGIVIGLCIYRLIDNWLSEKKNKTP